MNRIKSKPTTIIPYWGGSVAVWFNEDGSDTAFRSSFPTDQFEKVARGVDARGPGKDGYYWVDQEDSNSLMEALRSFSEKSGEDKSASWSWLMD